MHVYTFQNSSITNLGFMWLTVYKFYLKSNPWTGFLLEGLLFSVVWVNNSETNFCVFQSWVKNVEDNGIQISLNLWTIQEQWKRDKSMERGEPICAWLDWIKNEIHSFHLDIEIET